MMGGMVPEFTSPPILSGDGNESDESYDEVPWAVAIPGDPDSSGIAPGDGGGGMVPEYTGTPFVPEGAAPLMATHGVKETAFENFQNPTHPLYGFEESDPAGQQAAFEGLMTQRSQSVLPPGTPVPTWHSSVFPVESAGAPVGSAGAPVRSAGAPVRSAYWVYIFNCEEKPDCDKFVDRMRSSNREEDPGISELINLVSVVPQLPQWAAHAEESFRFSLQDYDDSLKKGFIETFSDAGLYGNIKDKETEGETRLWSETAREVYSSMTGVIAVVYYYEPMEMYFLTVKDPTPPVYNDSYGNKHETFDIRGIGPKRFLSAAFHTMKCSDSYYVGIDNNTMVIHSETNQVATYLDFIAHYHHHRKTLSDIYGGTKVTLKVRTDPTSRSIYKFIFIKPGLLSDVLYDPLLKKFKEDVDWLYRAFEFLIANRRGERQSKTNDFVITKYAPLNGGVSVPPPLDGGVSVPPPLDGGVSVPPPQPPQEDYYRYLFYYHRTIQAMGIHLLSPSTKKKPFVGVEKTLLNSITKPLGILPMTEDGVYMLNLILPKNKSPQHGLSLDDLGLRLKASPSAEQITGLSDTILYYDFLGKESDKNIWVINELKEGTGPPLEKKQNPTGLQADESEGALGTYDNMNLRLAICYNAFVGQFCKDREVDCEKYVVSGLSQSPDVTLKLVNTRSEEVGWFNCTITKV